MYQVYTMTLHGIGHLFGGRRTAAAPAAWVSGPPARAMA
jgi:hypothetical protein